MGYMLHDHWPGADGFHLAREVRLRMGATLCIELRAEDLEEC